MLKIVTDRDIRNASPSKATSLDIHETNYLLGKLKVTEFMTPKEKLITITPDPENKKGDVLDHAFNNSNYGFDHDSCYSLAHKPIHPHGGLH